MREFFLKKKKKGLMRERESWNRMLTNGKLKG